MGAAQQKECCRETHALCARLVELACATALSAALAVARAVQRAMRYASIVAAAVRAVLVPSRVHHSSAIHYSAAVTETPSRQQPSPARGSARLGRREESSAGARRRRSVPLLLLMGDVTGRAGVGTQPSVRSLRPLYTSPTPSRSPPTPVAARSASLLVDTATDGSQLHPGRPSRHLEGAHGRRRRGGCGATGRSGETGLRGFR